MKAKIELLVKGQLREDMRVELERVFQGHSCKGWNNWLQQRAKEAYDIDLTWRSADRLRRKLVEELQQRGIAVVRVRSRVRMATDEGDFDDAVKHHYTQALGHLRVVQRLRRFSRQTVVRELEKLFLSDEVKG